VIVKVLKKGGEKKVQTCH